MQGWVARWRQTSATTPRAAAPRRQSWRKARSSARVRGQRAQHAVRWRQRRRCRHVHLKACSCRQIEAADVADTIALRMASGGGCFRALRDRFRWVYRGENWYASISPCFPAPLRETRFWFKVRPLAGERRLVVKAGPAKSRRQPSCNPVLLAISLCPWLRAAAAWADSAGCLPRSARWRSRSSATMPRRTKTARTGPTSRTSART